MMSVIEMSTIVKCIETEGSFVIVRGWRSGGTGMTAKYKVLGIMKMF